MLQEVEQLAAWVYQIARNVVHDYHRNAMNSTVALADAEFAHDDVRELQTDCRSIGWLSEMILSLPDGYRQAVQ
jgi:DNA-directed RNA polymerase specialized sigma24 family protein